MIEPQTKVLPYILMCFTLLLVLLSVSVDLFQDCFPSLIAYQCTKPTTSCKPEKMKASLIVLFSHLVLSTLETGIFLSGKCKVSFHLDCGAKQI